MGVDGIGEGQYILEDWYEVTKRASERCNAKRCKRVVACVDSPELQ